MESFSIFRVSVEITSLQPIVEEEELAPGLRYSIQIGDSLDIWFLIYQPRLTVFTNTP